MQVIAPQEHRQIGEILHVPGVVGAVFGQEVRHTQGKGLVGARPDDDDFVRFVCCGLVVDRDIDNLDAFEPCLREPVRIGHLRRYPVHAPEGDEVRLLCGMEFEFHRLLSRNHGVSGRQVGMPAIVVPVAAGHRFLRAALPEVIIEQGQHIRESCHAADPCYAEEMHSTPVLEDLGSHAFHCFDHRGVVILCLQILSAFITVICLGHVHVCPGNEFLNLVVGQFEPLILPALEEFLRGLTRYGITGETGLDPIMEALAHHRPLDPAVAIEFTDEGQPLLTATRLPAVRRHVPVNIHGLAVSVSRHDPDGDAVANIGPKQAVVRVVRRAGKDKGVFELEFIPVEFFPVPVRVFSERIIDAEGLQEREFRSADGKARHPGERPLQKFPSVKTFHKSPLTISFLISQSWLGTSSSMDI